MARVEVKDPVIKVVEPGSVVLTLTNKEAQIIIAALGVLSSSEGEVYTLFDELDKAGIDWRAYEIHRRTGNNRSVKASGLSLVKAGG